MFYRKLLLLGSLPVFFTLAYGCGFFADGVQRRGSIIETWQTENKTFKVRVTSFEEEGSVVNGAYYMFESTSGDSNDWREIVIFRHDDQPKIPANQVRFVNDQVGYLFMGWIYAVTTDGGASWSVWDAKNDLSNWQCCDYGLIRDVSIGEDGVGKMRLKPISNRHGDAPELRTRDYGRHWTSG